MAIRELLSPKKLPQMPVEVEVQAPFFGLKIYFGKRMEHGFV
jgi:hypothetical protein